MADGVRLIHDQAQDGNHMVDHTEDSDVFTVDNLAGYDAVIWLQVSGDVLDEAGRVAFAGYLRNGGGFAAIHGPADAEWSWPEYEDIVGARFQYHPADGNQKADVVVEAEDPSTAHLPNPWQWADEWYVFKRNPRGHKEILLRVDESTYDTDAESMGEDHPVTWRGRYGKGRTWYTSLGHHAESYADPAFREHLRGGIASVLRAADR
jgi:type 1 glutamine amidotransferase